MQNSEDVFFRMHSVDGDLEVRNAEYVFTHQSVGDGLDVGPPETTIRGNVEDGYAETDGVSGDVVINDADGVFVPADAVGGDFAVVGVENVYSDSVEPGHTPREYDILLIGCEQSGSATDPDVSVYVTGMSHDVCVDGTRTDIEVYVVGHAHDISVDGRNATVEVVLLGYANTVRLGPNLSADVVAETGFDNEIVEEPYPVEDLIEMPKTDAFGNAGFGRRKVTFQVPAGDEDWCRNCGEPADAIIERH
ncbi:hypothetical protein [Haladaptatus halobius]|uniref:hypothetical protein n=1 Tax=Haladaptatus halobius TaxID=2884875 RepID=UPI001D0A0370|nr:hypothetical protein [Haladaptatus halobius]